MRNARYFLVVLGGTLAVSCAYPYINAGAESASGGTTSNGSVGGNGGMSAVGGSSSNSTSTNGGASNPVGGSQSSGGKPSTSNGGTMSTGGSVFTSIGGLVNFGGTVGTGGATTSGGVNATGGTTNTVSTQSIGGTLSSGGVQAAGGSAADGADSGSGCSGNFESIQSSTGLCISNMATIPAPSGFSDYSIDVTEVTRGQYAMWLAATTDATISGQDSTTCGWNTTFVTDSLCMGDASVCKSNCDTHPQVCVDWCDAFAYCKGVGKRLCGKIGGGPNGFSDDANSNSSQWFRACSSAGINTYPYGNYYSKPTCNGVDYWTSIGSSSATTLPVGTLTDCHAPTPYSGVYDLSGNVWEWEDSCEGFAPLATDSCHNRGGSFSMDSGFIACGIFSDVGQRNTPDTGTGFRCCSL